MGRIAAQQLLHTQPASGSSRMTLQTAQAGAKSAATNAFATEPILGIRDLGLGISSVTCVTRVRFQGLHETVQHFSDRFGQTYSLCQ